MEHEREVRSRPGRRRRALFFILTLIVLSIVTAWNVTRSEALAEAERAYARGDLAGCLQQALDHLERRPWSREAALLAARCLSRRDFAEEAEPYYRRAGRLSLNDQQVRAYFLARGPHHEHAIPAYREILRLEPDNVTAMRRLAAVLLVQVDRVQLLELADRLDRVPGGEVVGAMLRGTVHHNDENPEGAVASFERVLKLDPELNEMPASRKFFWLELGTDLIQCGRIEDAGRYLERAVSTNPSPDLINLIGYTYFLRGNLDEAERRYHQAAETDPSLYGPHLALAKLALQRRRYDEALRELDEARRLAPRGYGILYSMAMLYKQLGKAEEAGKIQAEIKELRQESVASSRTPYSAWPRYAL
jgi:tetratricopeptide (TPR) repeat protein